MAEHATTPAVDPVAACGDLCAHLFSEPMRIRDALTHEIDRPFHVAPHTHDGMLQLDVIDGCSGTAWIDETRRPLHGVTVMATYPGRSHGYELLPGRAASRVYLVKMSVERGWPFIRGHALPQLTTALPPQDALVDAMQAVVRYAALPGSQPLLLLARLAEAIALWPTGNAAADHHAGRHGDDPQLAPAVRLIEARPADPPSVEELAEAANLSPRHFARRFKKVFGATPHDMVTACRLQQARQLLLSRRLLVHQVADQLGFSSVATFSRWFSHEAGISPSQYQSDPSTL
jgi:AraC-like DNA-binding protein